MHSPLIALQSMFRRPVRTVVLVLAGFVLALSATWLTLGGVSASTLGKFGISEQGLVGRIGKLLHRIVPRADSAFAKKAVPSAPFATRTVTNGNDTGAGTLRDTIAAATSGDTIVFSGVTTVTLTSAELLINKNLTIDGGAAGITITRSSATQFRIFNISSGTVALNKLTITNGNTTSQAGGIQNSGTLTMTDCAITGNTSPQGAGIQNDGALTMTNCTVSGNISSGTGGGFAMFGTTTSLTNCTVSGNSASTGGGFSISSGTLSLTNCTVTNNSGSGGGGGMNLSGSSHVLKNTIVAGNSSVSNNNADIGGTVSSTSSYNLIGANGTGGLTNGTNGNQVGVASPLLNSLANNGGYTQTHSLMAGSPALDKGAAVSGLTTDQRGQMRPFDIGSIAAASGGNNSDIGAYEENPTCNTVTVNPTSLPGGTVGASYSQTITATGGDTAYTFAVTSGSLPAGLILQSDGTLIGLPTTTGTSNFTVTAYYGFGCPGSQAYSIVIAACANTKTYTVNDTGDAVDATPGDGVCATSGGVCTLRAAIQEINAAPVCDNNINFSVTGTINMSSAYPALAANITFTGPGATSLTVRRNTGNYRILTIPLGAGATISGLTFSNGLNDEGGAIRNAGPLTVTECAFSGNNSKGTNAGGPTGKTGGGGAIFNDSTGTLTITRSTLSGNTATGGNGETFTSNGSGGGGGGLGGAIFNNGGTVTVTNTTLSGNSAVGGNGGNGSTSCPTGPGGKGGGNGADATTAAGFGGGGFGGGNNGSPSVGGRFGGGGGGRANGGQAGVNGGFLGGKGANSTSSCVSGGGGGGGAAGGAIFNNGGTFTIVNATIVSNSATGGALGSQGGSGSAGSSRAGGIYNEVGTLTIKNSILAGNTAQQAGFEDSDFNSNAITTNGYNLFGSGTGNPTGGTQDQTIAPANVFTTAIGSLQYFGSTTQVHPPLSGSPVIDKGAAHSGITVDQRNKTRPIDQPSIPSASGGNASDIGAFEMQACSGVVSITPTTLTPFGAGTFNTRTLTASGGTSPYTFSLASGTLPVGVTLSSGGVLSGTANTTGTYSFSVQAYDQNDCNATQAYTLDVITCATVTAQPQSQAVCDGGSITLSVTLSDATGFSYQWRKGGANINGATNSTYTIATFTPADVASYDVVMTSASCQITSSAASLTTLGLTTMTNAMPYWAGRLNGAQFEVGTVASSGANTWPATEPPGNAFDGTFAKSLIRNTTNAGYVFTPGSCDPAGRVINQMRIYTANDTVARDPASYAIYGTNSVVSGNGPFALASFTLISSGSLALPSGRNTSSLSDTNSQLVSFANSTAYTSYMLVFPTNSGDGVSTQIGEVKFYPENYQPTLSTTAASVTQGQSSTGNSIGTAVAGTTQATNTLTTAVSSDGTNFSSSATLNGVTISNVAVAANGNVTASLTATCAATNATFTVRITNNQSQSVTATVNVNVTANTAPVLTYNNASITVGNGTTVNPATGPTDDGSIASIAVQSVSPSTSPATITVNNSTGVVTVPNNVPAGTYTVTIRATDNCGGVNGVTDATFTLTVGCVTSLTVNNTGDSADATPGNGVCETATGNGICTLRAAIQEANALTACSPMTIDFSVNGTITLGSALPAIGHPNLTITGNGAANTIISGNNTVAGLSVATNNRTLALNSLTITNANSTTNGAALSISGTNNTLTLTNCVLSNNTTTTNGGGLYLSGTGTTAMLTNTTVSGNTAANGGGLYVSVSTLTLNNCTISGNTCTGSGGGVLVTNGATVNANDSLFSNNSSPVRGAAIGSVNSSNVNVTRCTFTGHTGSSVMSSSLTTNITNSTISGNTGTGIEAVGGTTTITNSTFSANTGTNLFASSSGTVLSLVNTLVAGNSSCVQSSGATINATNSLIQGGLSCVNGTNTNNLTSAPLLGTLGNYGGTTQTVPLLPGSPAINAGTSSGAPTTDQRGSSRVGNVDIGAFESQGFTLTFASGSPQSTAVNTAFAAPLSVTVASVNSEPVDGGQVTFTPPGSGASATIAGNPATISGGAATSGTVTANATGGGPYTVAASATGVATNVNFSLTNTAALTVASINRASGTQACVNALVDWTVTFSASVTGVTASNFALTGGTGASITNVTGSNTTWTVTANVGTAAATLGLNMVNSTSVTPTVTGLPFTGQTYTINAPPTITLGASPSVFSGTTSANLPYSATTGSPDQYSIDYNPAANTAGFVDVTNAALGSSPIVLVVPGAAASGAYNATLTVRNSTTGCVSSSVAFTVTISACITSLTVNNTGDGADATPGNGVCETATGNGICTLRAALQEANALTTCSPFTISFSVNGTITLGSALPVIGHPNLTITGNGAANTVISGNNAYPGLSVTAASRTLALNDLTITNANSTTNGAALNFSGNGGTLTLNDCVLSNSTTTASGGGLSVAGNGTTATLTNTTVSGNTATSNSGGIQFQAETLTLTDCTLSGNTGPNGGLRASGVTLIANHTLFSNNNATLGSAGGGVNALSSTSNQIDSCTFTGNTGTGGAGAIYCVGTVSIKNSTFTNNTTTGGVGGVAVFGGTTTITNSTFSANGGPITGNVHAVNPSSTLNLVNTIVANALSGGQCGRSNVGTINATNSLIEGGLSCVNGTNTNNLTSAPLLSALGSYGGTTQTFALLPGSPAINAGTSTGAPTTDQRGITRDANPDIGAFESRGFTLAVNSGSPQATNVNATFASPLSVTVSSANSEPVDGGKVTFTPPGSGATATIAGNPATINSGIATSGAVTANPTAGGPYNVAASAAGAADVNFSLTNNALATAGITLVSANPACVSSSVSWTVSFSQAVTGLTASNFSLIGGTGATITNVSGSGMTWTVTASTGSAAATLGLNMVNSTGVSPTVTGLPITGQTYTVNGLPTPANAGPDQTLCATSATLAANSATVGTGAWSIVSGTGGTVTTPSSPTSAFTGVAGMTYTLRWTISNSPCTASTDDVVITLRANPTAANAGPDQSICTTATLAANTPGVGTGVWSVVSGPSLLTSQFSNTSSPTATFTPAGGAGNYVLRWTISNAPCTASSDEVTLTTNTAPTLTYGNTAINQGTATTVNPATGPTDNGSIASIVVQSVSPSTSPATITVNNSTGVVTVPNNVPVGIYTVTIRATDNCSTFTDAAFTLTVNANGPTLGNYPATMLNLSAQTSVTPNAAPTNTSSLMVKASSGFNGTFYANPTTGVVNIINAQPAGTHTVTVTAFGAGGSTTKTFTLTVQTGTACGTVPLFTSAANVTGVSSPRGTAVGDFNNDGKQDLATANGSSATVSIRLGDGAGGFTGTTTVSTPDNPNAVAVGDFNGDGNQDIAVSSSNNAVAIRLGDGAGGFTGTTNITTGQTTKSIALGDFNNDGKLDFVTANIGGDNSTVALGNGAGGFPTVSTVSVGDGPGQVVVADFNNDGNLDFATSNQLFNPPGSFGSPGTVTVRIGDGAGNFTNGPSYNVGNNPEYLAVGDFNEDGKPDLITSNQNSASLSLILGDVSNLITPPTPTTIAVSSGPGEIRVADINRDGHQDVAFKRSSFENFAYLLGTGTGSFGATVIVPVTGAADIKLAVGDFNADGYQDFVTANFGTNTLFVQLGGCNVAPTITAGGPLTRQQGSAGIVDTIATVNDTETLKQNLTVTVMSAPSGISVTSISAPDATTGVVTATVRADCNAATGNNTVVLKVTDSNGTTATANLTVTVNAATAPTPANAGADLPFCNITTVTLAANTPSVGTGAWSVVSGPSASTAQFNSLTNPAANFTPAGGLGSYTLRWTITGACAASNDDVVLTFTAPPTTANAGPDQTLCNVTSTTMAGNTASVGTGTWTQVNGPNTATITSPNSPTTTMTGLVTGVYTFQWTIANAPCTASSDQVTVTINAAPLMTTHPTNQSVALNGTATFMAAASGTPVPTVQWQVSTDGGMNYTNLSGQTSTTLTLSNVTANMNGNRYRAVFTNSCTTINSNAATLTIGCVTSLTVNNTGDGADATPGNGVCETATGNGICTLRAALQEANALTSCAPFTINFSVTGTIALGTELPSLNHPNLTLTGPGANVLTISGNNANRVFSLTSGDVTLEGLTIANGRVTGASAQGGGIRISSSGTVTIRNCALTNNALAASTSQGSGIYMAGGTLNISDSIFSGNSATISGGTNALGLGGGMYLSSGTVNITNTTFADNTCAGSGATNSNWGLGGGVYSSGALTLTNCTFSGNSVSGSGGTNPRSNGGGIYQNAGTVLLKNTLVAQNMASTGPDIWTFNAVTSQGNNLIGNNANATIINQMSTDLVGGGVNPVINPLLVSLGNYGGPTQTFALLPGSPAINAGTATGAPANDQRGIARDASIDIGAFESRGFTLSVAGGNNQSGFINTLFANPLSVTVSSSNSEPVNGGQVTFTPPGSGASATIAGTPATISGGTATTGAVTANAIIGGPYNVVASAAGATSINFALTNANSAPNFTPAMAINRQQGSPAGAAVTIGTVSDAQTAAGALVVTRVGGTATDLTVTGITNTNGTITAFVSAGCMAASGTVRFQVSDGNLTSTGDLQVNVSANTPPVFGYNTPHNVIAGSALTINPAASPSDNGSIASVLLLSQGTYTGGISVSPSGVVSISNAGPVGAHQITVQATDNCGLMTNGTFTLNIAPSNLPPSLTALPVNRAAGSQGASFIIAQVNDAETAINQLQFMLSSDGVNFGPTATLNGVTVALTGIAPNGQVTAMVTTTCVATTTTFTLNVTDAGGLSTTSPWTVTVPVNPAPVLSYSAQTVVVGQSLTVNPASGPSDNGTVASLALQSVTPALSGVSVNNTNGTVTINNAAAVGTYVIVIRAIDNCQMQTDATFTLNVTCPALSMSPTTLPNGVQGTVYNQTLTATPSGTAYSFAVTTNTLPPGLTLNANGTLSGTPNTPGNYSFVITATGFGTCTKSQSYNLLITGTCATITVNPATLPGGSLGGAYDQTVTATGGSAPYTFSVSQGALPPGMSLNSSTGALTGTPTQNGNYSFRLTATATGGCTGSRQYVLTVACPTLTFNPATLPNAIQGTNYSQAITVSPAGTYTFSLLLGSLPPGFTLNSAGLLSGITSQAGTFNFTIKALSGACQSTKAYTLVVSSSATALALMADYDGDARSDAALWSATDGTWRIRLSGRSSDQPVKTPRWGTAGDVALLGDYDGDGKSDLAVFRPSDATFYIKRSSDGGFLVKQWGLATDVPVPGDYDGDGRTDIAVWRGETGVWYIVRSSDQQPEVTAWGAGYAPYNDVAVPGDYDGDGRSDCAVFRRNPSHEGGTWLIRQSSTGKTFSQDWGLRTDRPVPGDYDGDGRTDIAVWRGDAGAWYIWQSATETVRVGLWGSATAPFYDQAVPGDYDGDGRTDFTVWRAADQTWYVQCSQDGKVQTQALGQTGDAPIQLRHK